MCWTTFLFLTLLNSEFYDRFFLPHHHIFCRQNKVGGLEFQRRFKHLHNQQMLSSQPIFLREAAPPFKCCVGSRKYFFLNCLNNGHTQRFLCFLGFFVLEVLPCFWNKIWLQRRTPFFELFYNLGKIRIKVALHVKNSHQFMVQLSA